MHFTSFHSISEKFASAQHDLDPVQWCRYFEDAEHIVLADKQSAPVLGFFKSANGGRRAEDIESVSAIVLDIDVPLTAEQLFAVIEKIDCTALIYSTYSSRPENDEFKVRIVAPLLEPVTPETYRDQHLPQRLAAKLGVVLIDKVSCVPSQVYFVPSTPDSERDEIHHVVDDYPPLNIEILPELSQAQILAITGQQAGKARSETSAKEDADASETVAMANAVVKVRFDGVQPIFTESQFFEFGGGSYQKIEKDALRQQLFVDVFGERKALSEIDAAMAVLAVRCYKETFPEASSLTIANLGGQTVDLLSGEVLPGDPAHHLRIRIPVNYIPNATCPQFLKFLDDIFIGDPDAQQKKDLLQEMFGYFLVPTAKFHTMLWLVGQGANGKSVLTSLLTALLGNDNVSATPMGKLGGRFMLADLAGKLANISDEVGADGVLPDDIIKQVTAGSRVQGERKFQNPFSFFPFARLIVAMNALPRTRDTSHGFFRRIKIILFNRVFKQEEQDRDLLNKLVAELPGILNWAIAGLQRLWGADAFSSPPSSEAALLQFKEEANPAAMFVRDALDVAKSANSKAKLLKGDVYSAYRIYCQQNGYMPKSSSSFGKELKALGVESTSSNGKTYYSVEFRPLDVWLTNRNEFDRMRSSSVTQTTFAEEFAANQVPQTGEMEGAHGVH